MMKQYILNEDERLPRLFVRFSPEISKQIDDIYVYNPNNIRGLFEWRTRIDWLIEYISNQAIAWDNTHRYWHSRRGTTRIKELGYDVTYMVKISKKTGIPYVLILNANLQPEEFGLKVPPQMNESKTINQIITEVINRYLKQNLILN